MKVSQVGTTYTKTGSAKAYDAYATWMGTSVCASAGQLNKHIRMGIVRGSCVPDIRFPAGAFFGFFPKAVGNTAYASDESRLWVPGEGGTDNTYNVAVDVICVKVEGSEFVYYKNDVKIHSKPDAGVGNAYVAIFLYEPGTTVVNVVGREYQ